MQNHRQLFIQALFKFIMDEQYVLLKCLGEDLRSLPLGTDLDILVTPTAEMVHFYKLIYCLNYKEKI